MYLIDTSVWIDFYREKETTGVKFFNQILDKGLPFGLTSLILQEILQGAAHQKDFNQLLKHMSTQIFYQPLDPILSYQRAAEHYYACRKKGITIRSSIDCLIAQIAIEHDLILVHQDRDFLLMAKVVKDLKLIEI